MNETPIVQMLVSGQNDMMWFESNLESLKSRYNNKFIAFGNREVIDADSTLDNLIKRLDERSIDTSNVFIKFVSKIKAIL